MRQLKFRFRAPRTYGAQYDPQTKRSFFFALNASKDDINVFTTEIEQYLTHETLHYVIHKLMGKKVQDQFDEMAKKVLKWNTEVYAMLF